MKQTSIKLVEAVTQVVRWSVVGIVLLIVASPTVVSIVSSV